MKECAFCPNKAETGEHLWDNWINRRIPKTRFNSSKYLALDAKPIKFVSVGLNEKLPVVCNKCNHGWMSALTDRVRLRFSEAILNGETVSITPEDAALLTAFTFMKATVKDYCYSGDDPFFRRNIRKRLKSTLAVPALARVWIAAFYGAARYSFRSNFYRVDVNTPSPLFGMEFFCYTYVCGHLAIQFLAPRWKDMDNRRKPLVVLSPNQIWSPATLRVWPYTGAVSWPPAQYLGDDALDPFINRFQAPVTITHR